MKKFAFLLIVFLFVAVPAFSAQEEELSFKNFCPYRECENIDTSKKYYLAYKKYWAKRKMDFETKKENCDKITNENEKNECYQKLKKEEEELTNSYIAANSSSSYYSHITTVNQINTVNNSGSTYNKSTYTQMNTYKPLNNYGTSSYSSNPVRMQPSYSHTNNSFNTWKPTSGHYGYGKW